MSALTTFAGKDARQVMIESGWEARAVDGRKDAQDEEWENPTIYIDAAKRREVESFAAKLDGAGLPSTQPSPEYTPYARMDAAALLTRISKDKPGLLQALQDAVLNKDLEAFVSALENEKAAKPGDLKQLKDALRSSNTEKFAEVLRKLAQPELEKILTQQATLTEDHWGNEVANTTDPLMGSERRTKGDSWLTCYDHNRYGNYDMIGVEPPVRGRPKDLKNIMYTTIELGYDADKWEEETLYHPYVLDTVNAASDMMMEANGMARLDGRIIGDRFTAEGAEKAALWSAGPQQTEG
mmetsp:Transcript_5560/g.12223  ORF Transcript_5560/g.12223 Transcript_5560/m.12223 type:complete len:296 (+) Transcript_5560:72-959(+)